MTDPTLETSTSSSKPTQRKPTAAVGSSRTAAALGYDSPPRKASGAPGSRDAKRLPRARPLRPVHPGEVLARGWSDVQAACSVALSHTTRVGGVYGSWRSSGLSAEGSRSTSHDGQPNEPAPHGQRRQRYGAEGHSGLDAVKPRPSHRWLQRRVRRVRRDRAGAAIELTANRHARCRALSFGSVAAKRLA